MRTSSVFSSRETGPKISLIAHPYDDTQDDLQKKQNVRLIPPALQQPVQSAPIKEPDLNKNDLASYVSSV